MRSKLFKATEFSAEGREHTAECVRTLTTLPDSTWKRLCDDLPRLSKLQGADLQQREVERQLTSLNLGRDQASKVSHLVSFVADGQAKEYTRGAAELVAADLVMLARGDVSGDVEVDEELVLRFVEYVIDRVAPALEAVKDERWYVAGVLPSLSEFGTTVELRAQLRNQFKIGDEIEQYEPTIVRMIPIASIRFSTDDDGAFSFQCDRTKLRQVIDRLVATEKELVLLDSMTGVQS